MRLLATLMTAAALTGGLLGITSAPASASPQIFCQVGYHKVIRHGQQVCVRNHHHHHHHHHDHDHDGR